MQSYFNNFFTQGLLLILYLSIIVPLFVYSIHRLIIIYLYVKYKKRKSKVQKKFDKLPKVTVQLPIFNEYNVVHRLIDSVTKIDYPSDLLEIQVLDDSTDKTYNLVKNICKKYVEEGINIKHIHRTNRVGYKAGALKNGTKYAEGEFLLIFDADFVAPKNIVNDMIHHFADEKIAVVQSRWGHLNKNRSILTHLQSIFLDGHFAIEQISRFKSNRFFHFNGTAGMWRKIAIEDAGNWEHDTITEDLDLSYRAQFKGWKLIYLNNVISNAEIPEDIFSFKSQQHRWAKGSTQTFFKHIKNVWQHKMPLKCKIDSTFHLATYFVCLLCVICLLFYPLAIYINVEFYKNYLSLIFLTQFISIFSISLFYFLTQVIDSRKDILKKLIYVPALMAFGIGMSVNNTIAIFEAIFGKKSVFVRTPKSGTSNEKNASKKNTKKYLNLNLLPVYIEFLMFFYTFAIACLTFLKKDWLSFQLFMFACIGFLYINILSLSTILAPLITKNIRKFKLIFNFNKKAQAIKLSKEYY